ncbi:glycerol-3-phosphate 1-O-acyltransferase PlsY [Salaquimonas pukyongi]|uniref:glycerol-3-phosphate 1-O-acyltransferase PlsY n=1 Tax=Salaquimonas pukyongi TaxID=2712698 RepID=UPI00096BB4AF|nr:glycerol-3-phosphate 1-O-acyltransferase PlsY [Salaquimonas pukyongi]
MPDPISWSHSLPYYLAALVFGYLLGAIPFGLIFARLAGLGDIRKIGSGNIGATNVLRSGRKGIAALTLLADMAKGALAAWLAGRFGPDPAVIAGLGAFLGHCFPVWLKFKGGKGVATYVGVLLALAWQGALVFAGVWLAVAAVTRYSSLSALAATLAVPAVLYWMGDIQVAELFMLMSALVWLFHRQNIARLLSGSESRIGGKG